MGQQSLAPHRLRHDHQEEEDVVVMETRYQRAPTTAKVVLFKPDAVPSSPTSDDSALGRTLDIGPTLTQRRRLELGHVPVISANHRVLTTSMVIALCFFTVSGGPVGTELAVATGGPLLGLLGFVLFPVVFNIPITYAIAELCSAFPEDGGFAMWILNAFGPFWGFLEGYWAWIRSVLDRILYVEILYTYVFTELLSVSVELSPVLQFLLKAAIAVVLTIPSLFGSRPLAVILMALLAVIVALVAVFSVWNLSVAQSTDQFAQIRLQDITGISDEGDSSSSSSSSSGSSSTTVTLSGPWDFHWVDFLNALFWSFDGFYLASVFGGEVSNPARTYPRAILLSFVLMWVVYAVPMVAAVAANEPHWATWVDYSYVDLIATAVGGSALHALMLAATIAGLVGMFLAELFCEAHQVSGMADCGLAPPVFSLRDDKFNTPRISIIFSLVAVLIGLAVASEDALELSNAFSAITELLIVATILKLRHTLPFVPRPTKVPGGIFVLTAVLVLPTALLGFLLVHALLQWKLLLLFVGITLVGAVAAFFQRRHLRSTSQKPPVY